MAYIDTSVLAAYYCPEKLSSAAEEAIRADRRPSISSLTEVEIYSAVSRKIREKQISLRDGQRIVATFRTHLALGSYHRILIQAGHFKNAGDWVSQFTTSLRTLDALHLAVCAVDRIQLVTADKKLHDAAHILKLDAILLF